MRREHLLISIWVIVFLFTGGLVWAACPSADITGDCFVDIEDFAIFSAQWLTGDPCVLDDMVYIPDGSFDMGDHHGDGDSDELPVHTISLDAFYMSRHETTNQQYCDYLNEAYDAGDIKVVSGVVYGSSDTSNSYPYCDTHSYSSCSQIDFSAGDFSVRTKSGRDMADDPMVEVSWYGAVAYCNWRSSEEGKEICYNLSTWECDFNKLGYRLPTEAEWEYAARGGEHNPYYRFPWGDPNTISHTQANYYSFWDGGIPYYEYDVSPTSGYHPLWNDGIYPYTLPVGFFDGSLRYKVDYDWPGIATSYQTEDGSNNYGLYDMAGNVWEWCHDWYSGTYYGSSPPSNPTGPASGSYRVLRGGGWNKFAYNCRVAGRYGNDPDHRISGGGFRFVLDL